VRYSPRDSPFPHTDPVVENLVSSVHEQGADSKLFDSREFKTRNTGVSEIRKALRLCHFHLPSRYHVSTLSIVDILLTHFVCFCA